MRFSTLIVKNLLRRGVRTALTVVGLSIGIAAVVAMLAIAWGFERSFLVIYQVTGIDLIVVRAGATQRLTSNLDASMGEQLKKLPGVRAIAASLVDVVSFEDAHLDSVIANGWEPESLLFTAIHLLSGRSLKPGDEHVVMLGRVLAINLGKKLGDKLNISGETFEVIGIFESPTLFYNGALIIPLSQLQWMMGRQGQVTSFVISAEHPEDSQAVEALRKKIEAEFPKVAASSGRDYVQNDVQIRLAKSMAWATSVVALIVGSVGMLNTMVMAVFERTREIGVLRALGWRRRRVLSLIMGEAFALGIVGAVLGMFIGFLGVRALAAMPASRLFVSSEVPPSVLAAGFALGLGLSLLGGLYPAIRGASLEPTEALRYE
jgi:putative ABC transport system permease protein